MSAVPLPLHPAPGHTGAEHGLLAIACAVLAGLLLVSPLAALGGSAFLLINLPRGVPRAIRVLLGLVLATAMAMLAGARPLLDDASNDIHGYFDVYDRLREGDLSAVTHFGGGIEVGLGLLMLAWAWLLPPLSENGLMACSAWTAAVLMLAWVESAFHETGELDRPRLLGICLLMLNLFFATQLIRQFLSLVVLLFALTAVTRPARWTWVAIATSFHLTALPFYLLWLLARRGWPGWLTILAAAVILRLTFATLLASFEILPGVAADKLLYYVDNQEDSAADLGSLRMVGLLGLVSIAAWASAGFRPAPERRAWLWLPWLTLAVHLLLLPIPLASLRTTLAVHSLLPGLIAFRMFDPRRSTILAIVLNVLLAYKMAAFAAAANGDNLRASWTMLASFLQ